MAAYIIVDLTVKDPEALKAYSSSTPALLAAHGGKLLAKGAPHVLHGEARNQSKALFEFPTKEAALAWYDSPEYQSLVAMRDKGMESHFHLIG